MIDYTHVIAGETVLIHFLEHEGDLDLLRDFLRREGKRPLGLDTETTGLDLYSTGFQIRLVQIGNEREAFVLRMDRFRKVIQAILNHKAYRWILHNAPYDALALFTSWTIADLREFISRCEDTRLLAHILDPRSKHEGGTGHALKPLSAKFIDRKAPDTDAGLHRIFKTLRRPYQQGEEIPTPMSWRKILDGLSGQEWMRAAKEKARIERLIEERKAKGKIVAVSEGWRWIPIDHPTYVLYSGLDAILATRLFAKLSSAVIDRQNWNLYQWERQIQRAAVMLQSRGMLLDVAYTEKLDGEYREEYAELEAQVATLGLAKLTSNRQLADALIARGARLTEKTDSGDWAVTKDVLQPLADDGDELARLVLDAKHLEKRRKAYLEASLKLRDTSDHVHPWIRSLQARTARMSVAEPPYQQLPSRKDEWQIRRCIIADPGQLIISADHQAEELKVLAALANVRRMKEAIAAGEDLHDFTASLLFGENFSHDDRQLAKVVGLGKVYGGGIDTLARQTGLPRDDVEVAVNAYNRAFPEIRRYGWRLADEIQGTGYVTTWKGRRLPVDKEFGYRGVNYMVQSTSRDVLAHGLLECERRGLDRYLLLPVHDELLGQAPAAEAEEVAREIADAMAMEIDGVPITATPEVYGRSWGSGYGCPVELDAA